MKSRKRPVLQWNAPPGIDSRTNTRLATPGEVALAKAMLDELEKNFLSVTLVPAAAQNSDGHMVRAVENRNPAWYRKFFKDQREQAKRCRIIRALKRVAHGRVRGNGYEVELLKLGFERNER